MEFSQIAAAAGIAKYPKEFDAIYETLAGDTAPACDLALIERLQAEYNTFGEYYDLVVEMANAVNADPNRSMWVKVAVAFAKDKSVAEARRVPVPAADGTQITAMLPLFILVPMIPNGIEEYRRRGFGDAEAARAASMAGSISTVKSHTGMPGINWLYYYWNILFVKAAIFRTNGLQFELRYVPDTTVYLKNKEDGTIQAVMNKGTFHASGIQPLGSVGYTDEEGAFTVSFREDEENYYGHASRLGLVDREETAFPKSLWEKAAAPGDPCLSLHIPSKANISPEIMAEAVEAAYALTRERYPEWNVVGVFGSSWILDPKLIGYTGEQSKITNLIRMFAIYPQKSDGKGAFGYVFPKNCTNYNDLPEDTSLQRKLKQLYLDGGYIHNYAGMIIK